jgi:hypothetical protein
MTQKEINKILTENKIHVWTGYYFEVVFGLVVCFSPAVAISIGNRFVYNDLLTILIVITSLLIGLIMSYGYLTERKLTRIVTNKEKSDNVTLIKNALKDLKWRYKTNKNTIELLDNNSYFIKHMLRVNIIPVDNEIVFNIMLSGVKGHFPYFFGVKTFHKHKLHKAIKKATHNIN